MARLIETDSLTNKDISAAVAIGAYTATAVRLLYVRVLAKQVAGNGDYVIYATLTKSAVEYRIIPITTANAATGVLAIGFVSTPIPMDVGDVVTVYLDGLAGDTTTPDTRVDFYEADYVRPAVTGRTLAIDASGQVTAGALANAIITAAAIATDAMIKLSPGLAWRGLVTEVVSTTDFKIATLAGLGDGAFQDATGPYYAFVRWNASGGGAAPQGEMKAVTNYVTAAGTFRTAAWSAALEVGDEIMILHPRVAQALAPATVGRTLAVDASGQATALLGTVV